MAKIKLKGGISLTDNQEVKVPKFNFSNYDGSGRTVYHNNAEYIDFVTDNGSLYVCLVDSVQPTGSIGSNSAFLKLVDRGPEGPKGKPGEDGVSAVEPRIGANFINDQLKVTVNDRTVAVSPSLTGPTGKPVRDGNILTWELTDDRISPSDINLMDLRPIDKCPLLLRTNSDNTKRDDEVSGPANFIQGKYEGDEHGTNLISISELMNLALCGICFWYDDNDGEWHFGNKEVLKATYHSDKNGRKIISRVELGDVLFDAGSIPINDYGVDIALINQRLDELENATPDLDGYATEDWVNAQGFLKDVPEVDAYTKAQSDERFQPKGDYVEGVSVNGGRVKRPVNGIVDLEIEEGEQIDAYTKDEADERFQPKGNYLTEHQRIKTINNQSLIGDGNIVISGGDTIDAYTKAESDARYLREHQSLAGLVKGVKVNNGEINSPDSNGIVNLTISAGETSLFDIKIENNHLYKTVDGEHWVDLGSVGGSSSDPTDLTQLKLRVGDPNDESKRNHLFVSYDGGQTGIDAGEFIDTDTKYELQGYATIQMLEDLYYQKSVLYTKTEIDNMLSGGDVDLTSYRTFTIYQRSASNNESDIHLPNDNIVAVWNVSEGVLDLPSGYTDGTNHPENATTQKPYLGTASATFESKQGSRVSPWDGPFCLTGENGKEGADGKGIEFIYHLGPAGVNSAKPSAPSIDYSKSKKGSDVNDRSKAGWETEASTDSCPGDGNNGYWTDNPQGISDLENEKVEWASIRRSHYDSEEEATVGEDFCSPFIWSMGGEDGMDGDGVEYLFCVTATEEEMEVYRTYIPIVGETYQDFDTRFPNYQTDDGYPKEAGGTPKKGTDNPLDVSENQPYEGVAIRKFNGSTESWGYFSKPKVWGLWGQKTIVQPSDTYYYYRPYTSYIFARSTEDLTERVLKTTGEYNNQTYAQWIGEDPNRKMEFYNNPLAYLITLKRDPNNNSQGVIDPDVIGSDSIPEAESPIHDLYLATNLIGDEEEEETAGDGPVRGGDSVGFQTEYAAASDETNAVYAKQKTLPVLDSYETADPLLDPDQDGINEDAGRTYVSEHGMGLGKDDNSIVEPTYMAVCHKNANGHWSAGTVTKVKGENGRNGIDGTDGSDGKSIEFVYYRTKGAEPSIKEVNDVERGTYDPEDAAQRTETDKDLDRDDFFPAVAIATKTDGDYWHDHPSGVTEQLPYEWVATRTSAIQNGRRYWTSKFSVALWSKFGADGRDGDGIEYVFGGVDKNDVINETGPTQKEQNEYNNNQNVNPNRKDSKQRSITVSEYLPAIRINGSYVEAVDDNPGITNNTYVYASMRKYNGASKEWGEFGEIKLWNEQNSTKLESIILDITDDSHSVQVDSNGRILDRYMNSIKYDTDGMYLYKNNVLLSNGDVYINNVKIAELIPNAVQSNCYSNTNNSVTVTSNGITATVTPHWVWKYENSNSSSVQLRVVFDQINNQNPILNGSFDIPIKVQSADGQYAGLDVLRIIPRYSDKDLELNHVPNTQRTSEKGGTTYSDRKFNFYGYYGDTYVPLSLIEKTHFYFKYDDQSDWTKFYIPSNDSRLINLRNNVDGKREILQSESHFYFDRNGNILSNSTDAFYEIWLYNRDQRDNIRGEGTNWAMQAYVIASAFTATEDYPINELYFGIGFDDNIILDEANVHIIYPGKNGGKGDKGDTVQDAYFLTAVYDEGAGNWATWFDNIRNGVSGYSGVPGELGQKGTVNIGTNIQTDTPVTLEQPTMTPALKYLWKTSRTVTYNGNTPSYGAWSVPVLASQAGTDGKNGETIVSYGYYEGKVLRLSNWSDPQLAFYAGDTVVDGVKYLDIVKAVGNNETKYFKCISDITYQSASDKGSDIDDKPSWQNYGEEFVDQPDSFFETLLANSAYVENLTVKHLNTAGEDNSINERIVASGNTMYMTDNTGAQRFKLTGDDINWTTPLATYPQQNTSYYGSYSNDTINDSFERSLFGTIAVSAPNSTLAVPALQITADVRGCTSGQPQDGTSIGINVNVYLYKDGTRHATIGSATLEYSPEDDIDITNVSISSKSFNVSTGNYTIVLVASINGQRGAQCSYVSVDLTFGSSANNVTVSSAETNENNVQIGSNGMAIQLGNGFAVIFGMDSNSSPLIQLQGTNSQGNTVGIRITSAGLEKNTGSGGGSL